MIVNASTLSGDNLEQIEESHITIEGGLITEVADGYSTGAVDCRKYLAAPSLFNAHTHVGDSFAKEAVFGMNASQAVGKDGAKWGIYPHSSPQERVDSMEDSMAYMLSSGTTSFADFRENGLEGIAELKKAAESIKIKPVILGRNVSEKECDGLGLNLYQEGQIPEPREKILALHAGESEGEVERALKHNPDVIIHYTKASKEEIRIAARKNISIVVCPRSNSCLQAGFPDVRGMLDAGVNVSLGTDNVMINQPNMFREMEYLSKASLLQGSMLSPQEVFALSSRNGAKAFRKNSGTIKKGADADIMFLDKNAPTLKGSKNLLASIVHRCEPENVRKVLVDGLFAVDKDKK